MNKPANGHREKFPLENNGNSYYTVREHWELVNAQAESRLLSLDPQPDLDNANVGTHGFAEEIGCASYEGAAVFFWHFIRQVAMNRGHHFSSRKKSQHRIMFHSLLF